MITPSERNNYEILRECVSSPIIQKSALPERRVRSRRAGRQRGGRRKKDDDNGKASPKRGEDVKAVVEGVDDEQHAPGDEDLVEFIDVCIYSVG